jgi:uncharacterized Tic20 family protein
MDTITEKNTATLIHLSALGQFVFPLSNYILPILIWTFKKEKSEYIDYTGKQVINFQLSILLYTIVLLLVAAPVFLIAFFNGLNFREVFENKDLFFEFVNFQNNYVLLSIGLIAFLILISIKFTEFFLILYASIKASEGEIYKYPFTIHFIK